MTECWVWDGGKTGKGYGLLPSHRYAHRAMWEMVHGPIPEGLQVCHRCDNPPCIRPSHLFLGTARDNKRDSVSKGRARGGRGGHGRKLTPDQVREIRRRTVAGEKYTILALVMGVSDQTVMMAAMGRTYRDVA